MSRRRLAAPLAFALSLALGASFVAAQQPPRVAEVQIAPRYLRMVVDAQAPLVATAYDRDGVPVDAPFQGSSSNINVAEVNADGLVRGVVQGTAVVTAATGAGAQRRYGQVTVFVGRPRGGIVIAPLPPPPKTPLTPGTPSTPLAPATHRTPNVDSIVRASIDCNEPFVAAANPMRACYDTRPRMREGSGFSVPPPQPGLPGTRARGHRHDAAGRRVR